MMRYQRVSPDFLPVSNGRKSHYKTCKEEDGVENGRSSNYMSSLEGKSFRFRSGTSPSNIGGTDHDFSHVISDAPQSEKHTITTPKNENHESSPNSSPSSGGDVLLQWGQNKRSRGSRSENRVVTDESSVEARQVIKIQRHRRLTTARIEKQSTTATMPPPPPPTTTTFNSYSRGGNLRPCMPIRESTRNSEERSVTGNGFPLRMGGSGSRIVSRSTDKRSSPSPEKIDKMVSCSSTSIQADPVNHVESNPAPPEQEAGATLGVAGGEKLDLDLFEWPRIYISLSRKEKEDDFLAMKGTKLPQRPKKRAKNIDKALQYCFPGIWLSDLTRGRYEVREKKCVKKQKRRGLKAMVSMDSDSES